MGKPGWLQGLMEETFFGTCRVHENTRKNEKNIFCLYCCIGFCSHCLPFHNSHPLLQVRRYVYHDVIRQDDLEKFIDCSYIQVDYYEFQGIDLSSILLSFNDSTLFTFCKFRGLSMVGSETAVMEDDVPMTSLLEEDSSSLHYEHGFTASMKVSNDMGEEHETHTKKKQRHNEGRLPHGISQSLGCRRKGAPRRSPLA